VCLHPICAAGFPSDSSGGAPRLPCSCSSRECAATSSARSSFRPDSAFLSRARVAWFRVLPRVRRHRFFSSCVRARRRREALDLSSDSCSRFRTQARRAFGLDFNPVRWICAPPAGFPFSLCCRSLLRGSASSGRSFPAVLLHRRFPLREKACCAHPLAVIVDAVASALSSRRPSVCCRMR
jgi:hypothetical protein